jgi:hypothetical protein
VGGNSALRASIVEMPTNGWHWNIQANNSMVHFSSRLALFGEQPTLALYTAGVSGGSGSIQFELWNQAGVESTGTTAVIAGAPANGIAMSQEDLASPAEVSDVTASYVTGGSSTAIGTLDDISGAPPVMPLNFSH